MTVSALAQRHVRRHLPHAIQPRRPGRDRRRHMLQQRQARLILHPRRNQLPIRRIPHRRQLPVTALRALAGERIQRGLVRGHLPAGLIRRSLGEEGVSVTAPRGHRPYRNPADHTVHHGAIG